MSGPPTLSDWVKGRPAIARLIGCIYDRVERGRLISPFPPGGVSVAHREHVTTWWCEVFGGPAGYTGRLGGYPAMMAHHRGLGITAGQRLRFALLMSLAAGEGRPVRASPPPLAPRWPTKSGTDARNSVRHASVPQMDSTGHSWT